MREQNPELEQEIKELKERLASLERKVQDPPDIDKIAGALAEEMEAIPPLDSVTLMRKDGDGMTEEKLDEIVAALSGLKLHEWKSVEDAVNRSYQEMTSRLELTDVSKLRKNIICNVVLR